MLGIVLFRFPLPIQTVTGINTVDQDFRLVKPDITRVEFLPSDIVVAYRIGIINTDPETGMSQAAQPVMQFRQIRYKS